MKLISSSGKYVTISLYKIDTIKGITIQGERPVEVALTSDEIMQLSNRPYALMQLAMGLFSAQHSIKDISEIKPKPKQLDLNL